MVALALYAVMEGQALSDKDKQLNNQVACSGRRDQISKEELDAVKKSR